MSSTMVLTVLWCLFTLPIYYLRCTTRDAGKLLIVGIPARPLVFLPIRVDLREPAVRLDFSAEAPLEFDAPRRPRGRLRWRVARLGVLAHDVVVELREVQRVLAVVLLRVPSALSRSLHALFDTYAALAADDARVTSCRRVRHPETLLACAMASADVCGRNLSAARAL